MTWNPEGYGLVTLAPPIPRRKVIRQHRIVPAGIAGLPGFAESLRLLLIEEEYALEDVGQMFGVSRERIRQLADHLGYVRQGAKRGVRAVRIWQDDEHRFRPVHKGILTQVAQYNRTTERQQRITAKYAERWAEAVAELRDLARQLERTPTIRELARRLGQGRNTGELVSYLFGRSRKGTPKSLAPIYADAGLPAPKRGGQAHVSGPCRPGHHQTECRRGHAMTPENTLRSANRRACRACHNLTSKQNYHDRKRRSHA